MSGVFKGFDKSLIFVITTTYKYRGWVFGYLFLNKKYKVYLLSKLLNLYIPRCFIECMKEILESDEESKKKKGEISEKRWHEHNFIDAMRFGYEQYREDESKHGEHGNTSTTLMVPRLILTTVNKIRRVYPSFSIRYIFYQMIKHGFAIIQNEYKDNVKKLDALRAPLEFAEIAPIQNFLSDVHIVVNGLKDPRRQNIVAPMYVSNALSDWSRILSTDRASLMRLCMYYSVTTIDMPEIETKVKPTAEKEVIMFREHITNLDALYQGFTLAESIKAKDKAEEKEEGDKK